MKAAFGSLVPIVEAKRGVIGGSDEGGIDSLRCKVVLAKLEILRLPFIGQAEEQPGEY